MTVNNNRPRVSCLLRETWTSKNKSCLQGIFSIVVSNSLKTKHPVNGENLDFKHKIIRIPDIYRSRSLSENSRTNVTMVEQRE